MAEVPTSKKNAVKPAVKPFEPSRKKAVAETVTAPLARPAKAPTPIDAIAPKAPLASAIVASAASTPVQPKSAAVAKVAAPIKTAAIDPVATAPKENKMNDTINQVQETIKNNTEEATAKASAFFNDANGRAKDAMAKGTKAIEELVDFSKGNLEAVVASGRVAAKGAEEIAKYSAEYGRSTIERANATARQFAAVKSPTEFFQLQGDVAKQTLDALVAEGAKFTENYMKLLGEMVQPLSNRYAVAAEKVKTSVVA